MRAPLAPRTRRVLRTVHRTTWLVRVGHEEPRTLSPTGCAQRAGKSLIGSRGHG